MTREYRGFTLKEDRKGRLVEGRKGKLAIMPETDADGNIVYAVYNDGERKKIVYHTVDKAINALTKELEPETEKSSIKIARENAGLTREEVEKVIGIPHVTLCSWETNKRKCPEWVERLLIAEIGRITDAKKKLGV